MKFFVWGLFLFIFWLEAFGFGRMSPMNVLASAALVGIYLKLFELGKIGSKIVRENEKIDTYNRSVNTYNEKIDAEEHF